MEFLVREAREEDAASMVELLNPIILSGKSTVMERPLDVDEQVEFLRGFPERGIFHVAVRSEDGRLVGLQDVVPTRSDVGHQEVGEVSTFVSRQAWRRGAGRALCRETSRVARGKGYRALRATIRADNPGAVAFYSSQGFRIASRTTLSIVVGGVPVDTVVAELALKRT